MNKIMYIIKANNTVALTINGHPHVVDSSHANYKMIIDALKSGNLDVIPDLVSITDAITTFGENKITVDGGVVFYKEKELHNVIGERILDMMKEGYNAKPLINFLENLMSNPSSTAINELYLFLEAGNLPITDDGHFIAYKKVRDDWFDCYSGTVDNSVGNVIEMERQFVDDNRQNTCSNGFHFATYDYARGFSGSRMLAVKINPADVVSIPYDYGNAKGRTCKYVVMEEIQFETEEFKDTVVYHKDELEENDNVEDEEHFVPEPDEEDFEDDEVEFKTTGTSLKPEDTSNLILSFTSRAKQREFLQDNPSYMNDDQGPEYEGVQRWKVKSRNGK